MLCTKKIPEKSTDFSTGGRSMQNPLILAVETSGRMGSVAIAITDQLLAETAFSAPMRHSAEIFPAVCGLLDRFNRKPQEIEHVYISAGPGSFTGLRIAVTMAKIMNLANAVKIVAVDTLDVIAANAADCITGEKNSEINKIAAIIDAKRGQFFIAAYQYKHQSSAMPCANNIRNTQRAIPQTDNGHWEKILPDCLISASEFLRQFAGTAEPVWLLGEGLVYYKNKFKADNIRILNEKYWNPTAAKVLSLGWHKALQGRFADAMTLVPNYIRKPEAEKKETVDSKQ